MRFALDLEHKDFYLKNGFVEFEQLLTPDQVDALKEAIQTTLTARLKKSLPQFTELSSQTIFQQGFDLWRDHPLIKKTLRKTPLSDIASQLFQTPILRMGFDQYINTDLGIQTPLSGHHSIQALSCAKPLLGALILCLSPNTISLSNLTIPSHIGHGIYINPNTPINWDELFHQKHLQLFIMGYASKKALYYLEPKNPHTHAWKKLGYVFGDRLKDSIHPIIYRS